MPSTLVIRQNDTYPPYTATLTDPNGPINLQAASGVQLLLKGEVTALITKTLTVLPPATITATATSGSNVLTGVSSFTNVYLGSSLTGSAIPEYALVGQYNATAETITMVDANGNPVYPTASGAVTVTVNTGTVQYAWQPGDTAVTDTYQAEHKITWSSGAIQTVPNDPANDPVVVVAPSL